MHASTRYALSLLLAGGVAIVACNFGPPRAPDVTLPDGSVRDAGDGGDAGPSDLDGAIPDGGGMCTTTDDCPPLWNCVSNVCEPPANDGGFDAGQGCETAENCPVHWMCVEGNCVPPAEIDAGVDAGIDAGPDGGTDLEDGGSPDGGLADGGLADGGLPDSGIDGGFPVDAGSPIDGGTVLPVGCSPWNGGGADLCIQLLWPEDYGDVDLHYIGPSGSFYEVSPYTGDLDWENSWSTAVGLLPPTPNCGGALGPCSSLNPDWGEDNTVAPDGLAANNPSMYLDQRWGYGPEVITHAEPFDGTYDVFVHYYCSYANESDEGLSYGSITAQVAVYAYGQLIWSGQQAGLTQSQVWEAAEITVSNGGASVTVSALDTAPYVVDQGCTE